VRAATSKKARKEEGKESETIKAGKTACQLAQKGDKLEEVKAIMWDPLQHQGGVGGGRSRRKDGNIDIPREIKRIWE